MFPCYLCWYRLGILKETFAVIFSYLKRLKKTLSHDKQPIITFVHVCLSPCPDSHCCTASSSIHNCLNTFFLSVCIGDKFNLFVTTWENDNRQNMTDYIDCTLFSEFINNIYKQILAKSVLAYCYMHERHLQNTWKIGKQIPVWMGWGSFLIQLGQNLFFSSIHIIHKPSHF